MGQYLSGDKVRIQQKKALPSGARLMKKQNTLSLQQKDFMINYRVENLGALIDQLRNDSVTIVDKVETADYGKFIHIMDIEGNKIELWEPNDIKFEKLGEKIGAKTTK